MLQVGMYAGEPPFQINANLLTDDGKIFNRDLTINTSDIIEGDSLMREAWYGLYLQSLEPFASSDEEKQFIIEQSINERVLTSLTAFLALEPGEGGEICVDCLQNNGGTIVGTTDEFSLGNLRLQISPNPATTKALIQLLSDQPLRLSDWTATIYDVTGRVVAQLVIDNAQDDVLIWKWNIGPEVNAGIYLCKVESEAESKIAKVMIGLR